MIGTGPGARSMKIPLKPFTLVAATTRAGLLTAPLRSRFGIVHRLDFYSEDDLEFIVTRSARHPGRAHRGGRSARDRAPQPGHAAHRQPPAAARARLRPGARRGCHHRRRGRARPSPCSRSTTTASTRSTASCCSPSSTSSAAGPSASAPWPPPSARSADAIEDIYEPYLLQIGFLDRTPRGRAATRRAYEHFGRVPPNAAPARRSCSEDLRLRLRRCRRADRPGAARRARRVAPSRPRPRDRASPRHRVFRDLPDLLAPGDLLVVNRSRVLPARLLGRRADGGAAEVLLVRPRAEDEWEALVRPAAGSGSGDEVSVAAADAVSASNPEAPAPRRPPPGLASRTGRAIRRTLERMGHVPLPPYIRRPTTARTTGSATRPSTPASGAAWPRPPRACTSRHSLSRPARRAGRDRRDRPPRRSGHLPAGQGRRRGRPPRRSRALRPPAETADAIRGRPRARRARRRRRDDHHARPGDARPRRAAWSSRATAKPTSSIVPGFRFRVVDAPRHQLPPAALVAAPAGRRLRGPRAHSGRLRGGGRAGAIASTATATRCSIV